MALPTLKHFTHPHVLTKEASDRRLGEGYQDGEFICHACNNIGSGNRYHCKRCEFDLHEECAACPEYLTTYLHPNHQLTLEWESKLIKKDYGVLRPCNVCGDQVSGLFYRCSSGERGFFLHPLCSQIQPQVRHVTDERHLLTFQSFPIIPDSSCTVCGGVVDASSWSYRCDPCGINIHLVCVTLPYFGASSSSRSPKDPHQPMHQERRPGPPLASPPYDVNAGTAPPDHSYPPSSHHYSYPPPPSSHYHSYPPSTHHYSYPPSSHYYSYTPTSHNYSYTPSSHNYSYAPAPAYGYSSMAMPLPPDHSYYTPSASPHQENTSSDGGSSQYTPASPQQETSSSSSGGSKRRMYAIVAKIAWSLIMTATLGVPHIT
ncbi:hypothetical protein MKW98_019759 [Papaver atlanticum]|uniref:DC1 domain-containing protein n=1 Tax=Papaver atlanticum TaxID=357466 RepID=A0AAD4XTL1_9MAGN|nr:hypothetical protein MKW98_019759 [Papaver atlanticum]